MAFHNTTSTVYTIVAKQPKQTDFHFKISGFLVAIKLTDKSGYPDNGYPDLQTLVLTQQVTHRVSGRVRRRAVLLQRIMATSYSDVGQQALTKDLVTVILTVYLRTCLYGFVNYGKYQ